MPSHDAYAEPEGSRTVTVVLLALLILAVIGALFGFVLGRRAASDIEDAESLPGDGKSARPVASASNRGVVVPGKACPDFIQEGVRKRDSKAATPVTLVLYVRTDKREAWICREADGTGLWYQGHDKRAGFHDDGEVPKEGENGLLLNNAVAAGTDRYQARNGSTRYLVSRKELQLEGDQNFTEPVVRSEP